MAIIIQNCKHCNNEASIAFEDAEYHLWCETLFEDLEYTDDCSINWATGTSFRGAVALWNEANYRDYEGILTLVKERKHGLETN